jgi:hypothetical protein
MMSMLLHHVGKGCFQTFFHLSLYSNPQSLLLFFFSCFLLFPRLDFLSRTYCYCCCCSLSLCKNQYGGERKKKIYLTTQIKALAPMKKKDSSSSSSSSSPWVLSAELQNLSANQTWNNNIYNNHGM